MLLKCTTLRLHANTNESNKINIDFFCNLVPMLLRLMGSQAIERFVGVPAEIAGVSDTGDVVRFNVLPYVVPGPLLSTNLANSCLAVFWQIYITDQHHGLDLFV